MTLKGLVGKFSYKAMRCSEIKAWDASVWGPSLGYTPTIFVLQRGWLGFLFRTEAHSTFVLNSTWICGQGSLMLWHWN